MKLTAKSSLGTKAVVLLTLCVPYLYGALVLIHS